MSVTLNILTLRTPEEVAENLGAILDAINTACLNLIEAAEIEPEDAIIALKRATTTKAAYNQLARQNQGMIFKLSRLGKSLADNILVTDINDKFLDSFPKDTDDLLGQIGDILTLNSVEEGLPLSPKAILRKLQAENDDTEELKEADIIAKLEELKTVLATIGMELIEQDGGYVILATAKSETEEDDDELETETATIKETAQIFRTTIETATSALEVLLNANDQEKRKALAKIEQSDPASIIAKIKEATENCTNAHKIVQTGEDHHVPPAYFEAQKPASMTPMLEKIAQAIINSPIPIGIAEICKQIGAREVDICCEMQHVASALACMGIHLMVKTVITSKDKHKIYYTVWMSPDEEIPDASDLGSQTGSKNRRGRPRRSIPKQEIPEGKPKFADFFMEYDFVFPDRVARLIAKVLMEEADDDQQPMSVEAIHATINNPEITLRDVQLAMRIVRSACAKIGINLESVIRRIKAKEKNALTYRALWDLDFTGTLPTKAALETGDATPRRKTTAPKTVLTPPQLEPKSTAAELEDDGPPILTVEEQIAWVVAVLSDLHEDGSLAEDPATAKDLCAWAKEDGWVEGTEPHTLTVLADPTNIETICLRVPGLKIIGKNDALKFTADPASTESAE